MTLDICHSVLFPGSGHVVVNVRYTSFQFSRVENCRPAEKATTTPGTPGPVRAAAARQSPKPVNRPSSKHANRRRGHDRRGEPAQSFKPDAKRELPHHSRSRGEQHNHRHDRHSRDAIDYGAPEQRLDRIERREIQ